MSKFFYCSLDVAAFQYRRTGNEPTGACGGESRRGLKGYSPVNAYYKLGVSLSQIFNFWENTFVERLTLIANLFDPHTLHEIKLLNVWKNLFV